MDRFRESGVFRVIAIQSVRAASFRDFRCLSLADAVELMESTQIPYMARIAFELDTL